MKRLNLHITTDHQAALKRCFALVIVLLISSFALKAQVKFTCSANRTTLAVGERFQIQYQLNTKGAHFTPPDFGNFRVLSGPNQSTSMQVINGSMSSSIGFSYILAAVKKGEFTIHPAAIKVNGKVVKSNSLKIKVGKGNAQAQSGNASKGGSNKNSVPAGENKNLFIKTLVSKTNPYIGEQITLTYKLYTRLGISRSNLSKNPDLNGFWSQAIETEQVQRKEMVNGEQYNVIKFKQTLLFPQRSGKLVIDPIELNFIVQQQSQRRSRSLFDQFFGSYENVNMDVKSKPITINVKPLPKNKPESFSGAVGYFDMSVEASKNQVKANEAIDLRVKVSGKGNLKLIENPEVKLPSDFELYDPKINDKISAGAEGLSGSRTYNYLTIPRVKGNYVIEPIVFSYFNPATGKYKTISSQEIPIAVEKGESEEVNTAYSNISKEDVKILGNDIKYIKPQTTPLVVKGTQFIGTWIFYLLVLLPILLFVVVFILRKNYIKANSDVTKVKSSKATKVANKKLAVAKKHLNTGDDKLFYEEISKALYGYTSDKLNIGLADLSKEKINELLSEKSVNGTFIKELIDILETSEMARFAPMGAGSQQNIYDRSSEVIKNIENELKS